MVLILDGRAASTRMTSQLKTEATLLRECGIEPTLEIILVGDDKHSKRYVEMKTRRCRELGIEVIVQSFPGTESQSRIMDFVRSTNLDPSVHGILVQLPLPEGFDEGEIVKTITMDKDVDGLSPASLGQAFIGGNAFLSAGAEAILALLQDYALDVEHRHWVIVGMSNITGKPLSVALSARAIAYTCCPASDPELSRYTRDADILVVDIGRAKAITPDMVKRDVVVLDNGNNYEGGKVYGDVDFDRVKDKALAITPVPGGIGPMTITMLARNTLQAAHTGISRDRGVVLR